MQQFPVLKKYRTRRLIQSSLFVLVCLIAIYKFMSAAINMLHSQPVLKAEAGDSLYLTNKEVYYQSIPGLVYDKVEPKKADEKLPLFNLEEILTGWNLDDCSPMKWIGSPAYPNKGKGIPRYDFSNLSERKLALERRKLEQPFIVYNVAELDRTSELWSYSYLSEQFKSQPREVELSSSNHFMYYVPKNVQNYVRTHPEYKEPQTDIMMTFEEFSAIAYRQKSVSSIATGEPLYYMTINAREGMRTEFIRDGMKIFDPDNNFFVVEPEDQNGINCRFGMQGVNAAAHYDGRRNFIAMVHGRKRYVLLPPEACSSLSLFPRGHPSARHSSIDWSNMTEIMKDAKFLAAPATEAVIARGDVLYIPSYWFHYIVSLDASVQCNSRSGDSEVGRKYIEMCGFKS